MPGPKIVNIKVETLQKYSHFVLELRVSGKKTVLCSLSVLVPSISVFFHNTRIEIQAREKREENYGVE